MKALGIAPEQFITDAKGERVGVLLDLKRYERLREAEEELADIQSYDAARSKVLAEVKSGPRLAKIPVVIFTSSQASSDVMRSYALGANCYLRKPGTFPTLWRNGGPQAA